MEKNNSLFLLLLLGGTATYMLLNKKKVYTTRVEVPVPDIINWQQYQQRYQPPSQGLYYPPISTVDKVNQLINATKNFIDTVKPAAYRGSDGQLHNAKYLSPDDTINGLFDGIENIELGITHRGKKYLVTKKQVIPL